MYYEDPDKNTIEANDRPLIIVSLERTLRRCVSSVLAHVEVELPGALVHDSVLPLGESWPTSDSKGQDPFAARCHSSVFSPMGSTAA